MKGITIVIVFTLLISLTTTNLIDRYQQFKKYAQEYNKRYESKAIEFYRFAIYLKNLAEIAELNADP